jgi:hypothetical protein
MKRLHVLVIALMLAIAAAAGLAAAVRTTHVGAAAHVRVADSRIAQRNRQLNRIEASLAAQARRKPPALPPVGTAVTPRARPASVVYVRPKPIVHVVHRVGGEHENERETNGGDEGAGFDD